MLDVAVDGLLERQGLRLAMINGEHVDAEGGGQLRVLVEVVNDHLRDGIALKLDDHAGVFIGFIANSRNLGEDLFIGQLCNALDERGAVDVVRDLGDDNLLFAATHFFHAEAATDLDGAFAGGEIILHGLEPGDGTAGREIGTLNVFHQALEVDIRIIDLGANAINHFAEVMRRNIGGHTDGDAGTAVDE